MRATEQRHPLDVGAHAQFGGQACLERGHGQPGDGRRGDQVDLLRRDARLLAGPQQGLLAELHGHFDVGVVELGEPVELAVALDGQGQMPCLHAAGLGEPGEGTAVTLQLRDDLVLRVDVPG
jgi:hypothetical protein